MIPNQTRSKPPMLVIGMTSLLFLILSAINVWAKPSLDGSLRYTIPTYTPTATPRTGGLCVEVYHDRNADRLRQPGSEELLARAMVSVADAAESQIVASATTVAGEQTCFTGLEPALYVVREQDPKGYISTTDDAWGAVITSNVTILIPFGDILDPAQAERLYLPLILRNATRGS